MATMTPSTLRIGRRYRPGRLAKQYDAVVIGSGMGGLTSAALLSDLGWKVCVLEQHYTAGGYTHSYERNGYEWDVGVHYIGDVGAKTGTRQMFDYLSGGTLAFAPMAEEYDRFYIGDKVFNAIAGKDQFRANLVRQFPREEKAIDRYLKLLAKAGRAMPAIGMRRALGFWQRILMSPYLLLKTPRFLFRNTWDVLSELTDDKDLLAVWCGQWGDMGLPPKQSTFLVHAMIVRHYLHGGYYPVGGSWRIADSIIPKIQAAGGEVFTYAEVKEIVVEAGKTRGVMMKDGHFIECPCVISSAGVANTFRKLLSADVAEHAGYQKKLENVEPSFAHLGVYIGLKATAVELGLPKTNFWIYPDNDYDAAVERFMNDQHAAFPVVYISFPSAKDPDYLERHPGTATIEIVAPAPYQWFEKWRDETWGKRGEDYDALKHALGERLMEHLYEKLPGLRGKVDYYEVSTPLSTNWFGGYQQGELYGLSHTPKRMQQKWLRPKTTVPGLWLTGQDILTCGVTGAMMAGVLTATTIVGVRKIAPLMKRIYS
ncbi:MAG: NAD(P)/FAD-dependent oxidoreductase [Gammaproteobacteria bacterium]|nr:NAD(P)/FAD-dependent oxidoreductase [Gammaproteobacteria bacterium]MDH5241504.1 NAD(P)/FAD-dependent oxidoreductase [Gammaproteobacteria bacterium]MDH5261649.1 NAD(P)/FAD-dependent oxidoreductase [Gammaproteobacteria bacterium]MDH5583737.1 NAD(P)/FAD-dependent oxidoreductase [Gammaproteobacteria bacterium]